MLAFFSNHSRTDNSSNNKIPKTLTKEKKITNCNSNATNSKHLPVFFGIISNFHLQFATHLRSLPKN